MAGILLGLAAAAAGACKPSAPGLTFWAMGQEGERVGKVLAPFLAAHPEIRLKLQVIPWGAAHDKLLTAYAGHATPDVCQLGNTWVTEFRAMDALAGLDGLIKASKIIDRNDYFDGIWRANVLDGQVFGIPWYVDTRALFYRSDLLAAAGLEVPETWQELAVAAGRLSSRPGVVPRHYGITLPANPGGSPIPLFFAWQNGADLLNPDATLSTVRTPAFEEAVSYYADFFNQGSSPREAGGLTNFYKAFADGLFAMFISGPWDVQGLREKMPQLKGKWAVAPLPPRFKGGPRSSLAGGSSLVVFKDARLPDQAWQLVEFLSKPDVQAAFYDATTDLPARRSAWRSPKLAGDPAVGAFYTQLLEARPAPQVPEWEQLQDKLGTSIEKVVYGKASSHDAMAGLALELDKILEKRRWLKAKGGRP